MARLTLSKFRADAMWSDTPDRDYPGYLDDTDAAGMVYTGPDGGFALFIRAINTLRDKYEVDLFGDDYRGTLADCEAELWHAARVEGVIK